MNVKTNEATLSKMGEYFHEGNVAGIVAMLTADVVWTLPAPSQLPYGGQYNGHAGYAEWYRRVQTTLHFTGVETLSVVGQDNQVVMLGREKGIAKPTGQPYGYEWAQVYTFNADGLISNMTQYFNPGNILQALSVPQALPAIPEGFSLPFYYSSLTNMEVLYLVDSTKVAPYLAGTGLRAANFGGHACVSYNFQSYTGQFPNGSSLVQEIELNVVAYPETLAGFTGQVDFAAFVMGDDQTKLLGNHRVHVPCDSDLAIQAGIKLFGEPKFKTTFDSDLPALNAPAVQTWSFTCQDPTDANTAIFTCTANLQGLGAQAANISPQTEFGLFGGKLIGCRWNMLQPYQAYLLSEQDAERVKLSLGSSTHAMRQDLATLIGGARAAAVRTFQSQPAAIQSRAYYI